MKTKTMHPEIYQYGKVRDDQPQPVRPHYSKDTKLETAELINSIIRKAQKDIEEAKQSISPVNEGRYVVCWPDYLMTAYSARMEEARTTIYKAAAALHPEIFERPKATHLQTTLYNGAGQKPLAMTLNSFYQLFIDKTTQTIEMLKKQLKSL